MEKEKEELNEWILYHIHHDHGPPTLFVTLSCAELWWPDLKRLLAERLNSFGTKTYDELATKILEGDHKSSMKAVNLFTTLVQEYFHKRVEEWLNTVGRKISKLNIIGALMNLHLEEDKFIFICLQLQKINCRICINITL